MNFVIFVVYTTVAIVIFKKSRKNSLAKGRGKFRASATSYVISFVSFFLLMGIGSHFDVKQDPTSAATESSSSPNNHSLAKLTDSNDTVTTFNLSHPYEKAVYDNIKQMPDIQPRLNMSSADSEAQDKRDGALMFFRIYGLSEDDFSRLVRPVCIGEINHMKAVYHNETSLWLPLNNNNYVVKAEEERRKEWNKQYYARLEGVYKRMNECMFTVSQQQPMHILRQPGIK